MPDLTDYVPELPDLDRYRPTKHDNSALRARLAGAKIEDRPILVELHEAMAERDAFATEPATR
jgi:hypothetical protein